MAGNYLANEKGIVLPVVAVIVAILTILGFTAAYVVENQAALSKVFTKSRNALYYAEAGVNEYLWHLNKDSKFYEHDEDFIFESDGVTPCTHSVSGGYYQLEITPPDTEKPVVTIKSTGWAAGAPANKRTIEVSVHKRQFVEHIFFSGVERSPNNEPVWWTTGDEVWGPFHTNHHAGQARHKK